MAAGADARFQIAEAGQIDQADHGKAGVAEDMAWNVEEAGRAAGLGA